jgi:hypothetical protein
MRGKACISVALLIGACTKGPAAEPARTEPDAAPARPPAEPFCPRRELDPPRTIVERPCGTARAVLTDGARTAVIEGSERLFGEASAASAVRTRGWVRLLPTAFGGSLDAALEAWLEAALADQRPDVLAVAMQYLEGAPAVVENGVQIAGDAAYGPLSDLGTRVEGADFNDYLGLRWTFPDGTADRPKPEMLHSLDCSGYMRMLWGYRGGLPLAVAQSNAALSRRAVQMATSTFGVTIIADGEGAGHCWAGCRWVTWCSSTPIRWTALPSTTWAWRWGGTRPGTCASSPAARAPTDPPWVTFTVRRSSTALAFTRGRSGRPAGCSLRAAFRVTIGKSGTLPPLAR